MGMDEWKKRLVEWRRHLHQNPELSFEEVETTSYIIEQVKSYQVLQSNLVKIN